MPTGNVSWEVLMLCVAIAGGSAGGTWWLARLLNGIKKGIEGVRTDLKNDISALKTSMEESRVAVAFKAAQLNPGLKVPDPRNPNHFIVVQKNHQNVG